MKTSEMMSNLITNYYFRGFVKINLGIFTLLILTRFLIPQGSFNLILYLSVMIMLAIYAKANFELKKPYIGASATLWILFVTRLSTVLAVREKIGVFAQTDQATLDRYLSLLTSNTAIEVCTWIALGAVFLSLLELYLSSLKHVHKNNSVIEEMI